ncbi:MAG: hypothetical protein ACLVG5_14680 [Clostridium sp.]
MITDDQILNWAKSTPFSEEEWYQIPSGMVTVMTALWIWLKMKKKEGKK